MIAKELLKIISTYTNDFLNLGRNQEYFGRSPSSGLCCNANRIKSAEDFRL